MKISIVIVNYNVVYFLEQCLNSVYKSIKGIDAEVFVVDNNSVDESLAMVRVKFPQVKLIANKVNTGFSVANNQAILESTGEYVLLLNPDTLVQEDTLEKVIRFMDENQQAGGLGIKMIDGKGNFLPESKRGLPTPAVAFYKIFGLSALFPNSRKFGKYHLGYLSKEENHDVEILSGAFMVLRKSVLDKIGLLDETFFMYGEDIDLSYRILKAGYKNYYFADSQIIHYKGESTKKGSLNYVFVFYKAMVIFANKHFSGNNARYFALLINTAIWLRASLSVFKRFAKLIALPFVDFSLLYLVLFQLRLGYEAYSNKTLDDAIVAWAFPSLALLSVVVGVFSELYDRPYLAKKGIKTSVITLFLSLSLYSLLPEELRFSRFLVLANSIVFLGYILLSRFALAFAKISFYGSTLKKQRNFAVIGSELERTRVKLLLEQHKQQKINIYDLAENQLDQLQEYVRIHKIDELIFCAKDLSAQQIIEQMTKINQVDVDFKIAPPESLFIIGSNSIDNQGDYYLLEMTGINSAVNKRSKRLFDLISSALIFLLFPVLIFVQRNKSKFFQQTFLVLLGELTWVGFNKIYSDKLNNNPVKKGVLSLSANQNSDEQIVKENLVYAKNYSWTKDLQVILRNKLQIA